MLVEGFWWDGLGCRALGKAGAPARDVVGNTELQVRLAEGSHYAISPGVVWAHGEQLLIIIPAVFLGFLPVVLTVEVNSCPHHHLENWWTAKPTSYVSIIFPRLLVSNTLEEICISISSLNLPGLAVGISSLHQLQ